MWKKIFLVQTCLCMFLISGYIAVSKSDFTALQEKQSHAVAAMSRHYTASDIYDAGKDAVAAIIKTPAVVTGYILKVQDSHQYAEPIDPVTEGAVTSIYAVSGGQVIETGENDKLGNYIKIKHDGAVSVYGRCTRIYAKEGKHVRRGQVIGSYIQDENNIFYYDLIKE